MDFPEAYILYELTVWIISFRIHWSNTSFDSGPTVTWPRCDIHISSARNI